MKHIDQNRSKFIVSTLLDQLKRIKRYNAYFSESGARKPGYHGDKAKNRTPKLLFHCYDIKLNLQNLKWHPANREKRTRENVLGAESAPPIDIDLQTNTKDFQSQGK